MKNLLKIALFTTTFILAAFYGGWLWILAVPVFLLYIISLVSLMLGMSDKQVMALATDKPKTTIKRVVGILFSLTNLVVLLLCAYFLESSFLLTVFIVQLVLTLSLGFKVAALRKKLAAN